MGWDIDRFPEGEVNLELICCICTCILEDPVESPCRHVFCSQCIKTWLSNQKSCPHCRAPVHKRDLQSVVPLLKNIISKQKIYCDNKNRGCNDVVPLESLQGHIVSCSYGVVPCTYEGCNVRVLRKDHKAHTEVCAKRTVMCEQGCEMFLTLGEQTSHNCIQALRSHFQDVTNELLGRISKLEELVNDLVSKSNHTNPRNHHNQPQQQQQQHRNNNRDNNETFDCVSYNIPSPRSFTSDPPPYTVLENELNGLDNTINLDGYPNEHNDYSDSVESVESDSALNEHHNTFVNRTTINSPARRGSVTYDPDMSPVYERGSTTLDNVGSGVREVRGRRESRRPSRHRQRSRSPQHTSQGGRDVLDATYSATNNANTNSNRRRPHREHNGRPSRDGDDSLVLRIGVSQTVSDSSSSSSSSTDSDTD